MKNHTTANTGSCLGCAFIAALAICTGIAAATYCTILCLP